MPNLKEVLYSLDPSFKEAPKDKQDLIVGDLENNPDKMNEVFTGLDPSYANAPQSKKFQVVNDLTNRDILPTFGNAFGQGAGETVTGAGNILKSIHGTIFGDERPTPLFDNIIQGGKDTTEYYKPKTPYARAVDDNSIATTITKEIPKLGATLPIQALTAKPFTALANVGKFAPITKAIAENVGAGLGYSGFKYGAKEYKGEDILDDVAIDTVAGGAFYGIFKALGKGYDGLSPYAKKAVKSAKNAFQKGDTKTAQTIIDDIAGDTTVQKTLELDGSFDMKKFLQDTKPEKVIPDDALVLKAQGGNTLGGALGGGALGGTEAVYEDTVEGKDLSMEDYLLRIGAGAGAGAILGKKYGGKDGSKMFVGAKSNTKGAFSDVSDKKTKAWLPDDELAVKRHMYYGSDTDAMYIKNRPNRIAELEAKAKEMLSDPKYTKEQKQTITKNLASQVERLNGYNPQGYIKDSLTIHTENPDRLKLKTVGDFFEHKKLFARYPKLADVALEVKKLDPNLKGSYSPKTGTITLNSNLDKDGAKRVILHELQHKIQGIEGWAKGGSANTVHPLDMIETLRQEYGELPFFKKLDDAFANGMLDEGRYYEEFINTTAPNYGGVPKLRHYTYQRLAGEQEARAVQAKYDLPEQTPYQALKTLEGDLPQPTVRFETDGSAQSVDLAKKANTARVNYEAIPSDKLGGMKNEFYKKVSATPEMRANFTKAIANAVTDSNGDSELFKLWGKNVKDTGDAIGSWEGIHNPLRVMEVPVKITDNVVDATDAQMLKWVDASMGKMLHQDGLGHFVKGSAKTLDDVGIVEFTIPKKLDIKLIDEIEKVSGLTVIDSPHTGKFQLVNFEDLPTADFLAKIDLVEKKFMPDSVVGFSKIDDYYAHTGNYDDTLKGVYDEISDRGRLEELKKGYDVLQEKIENVFRKQAGEVGIRWDDTAKVKTPKSNKTLYAQGGGMVAGIEEDEDGNLQYNLAKGVAGVAGTYVAFKATEQIFKAFKKGDLTGDALNILQPESKIKLFQRAMQDKFNRVKTLINTKANIDTISDNLNIYQKEELYHGRVGTAIKSFYKDTVEPIAVKIRKAGVTTDEVDKYLHARHAVERNEKMFALNGIEDGSGMSEKEAMKIVKQYANNKPMNDIANSVYEMNKNRLKMIRAEGLESDEFIKQLESGYDNYVPLKRKFEEGATFKGQNTGKGFDIKGKEFKRAKGSHRQVESPLNNSILDYQETIIRSEKNQVGKSLYDFIEKYPDPSIYEVKGLKHLPQYDDTGKLLSYNPKYQLADNVLHVKIDGKIKEITMHDPALASAMKNLGSEKMGALMGYAHKAVRFLAGVNTQWNPEFTLSNFQRDIQTAFFNMPESVKVNRATLFKDVGSAMRGIYRNERGKVAQNNQWSKLYKEMKSVGGTTGWLEQYDVATVAKKMEKVVKAQSGKALPRKVFDGVFDLIDDANTAVENSARLVAYKMAKDSGLTPAKSASIAKNLTVNFNRKGEWGTTLNTLYMFYNASIQGTVRMGEQMVKSPKTQKLVTGLMAGSVGLYYYNISKNKEAYDRIPEYVKDTNYIFMNEDGKYQTVKVPYGFNIFKTVGDMVAEVSNGDMEANKLPSRLITSALNAFNPIGTSPTISQSVSPTLVRPVVDLELNKNFIGSRIAPESNPYAPKNKPDSHTSFKSVNPTLKKMATSLNDATGGNRHESGMMDVSPETMEYLLEFATGGIGKLLNRTYTAVDKTAKGEKVEMHTIPFLRQFHHVPREKESLYRARDLYQDSGVNKLSKRERNNFTKWMKEAVQKKEIEPKKFLQLMKSFNANQALLDFTSKHDIQSYEEIRKNPKLLQDALRMGITKTQLKKFLLTEE